MTLHPINRLKLIALKYCSKTKRYCRTKPGSYRCVINLEYNDIYSFQMSPRMLLASFLCFYHGCAFWECLQFPFLYNQIVYEPSTFPLIELECSNI